MEEPVSLETVRSGFAMKITQFAMKMAALWNSLYAKRSPGLSMTSRIPGVRASGSQRCKYIMSGCKDEEMGNYKRFILVTLCPE